MPPSLLLSGICMLALSLFASTAALAHPGGLNAEGCHNDRKRGGYHCHRSATATPGGNAPARAAVPRFVDPGRPYRNCSEARAAGAAPVRIGDPGYGPHLDRDEDGIGCE